MRHILRPGRNCWNIQRVRTTGLLIDGHDYYFAFYHAAQRAKNYILISGWQFDSDVRLLRGDDAHGAGRSSGFLRFLNSLCEEKQELHIYILAWDFSIVFMMEREWLQEWLFNWSTNERIHFLFDNNHPIGASQHQKFVVIDGCLAFTGGMDICASRWDDRQHKPYNPDRIDSDNKPYGPYHDVQAYHTGPLAQQLAGLFARRWRHLTNESLDLPVLWNGCGSEMEGGVVLHANRVGVSRTQAKTFDSVQDSIVEIKNLYCDAIGAAEKLIYIENQYFSSYAVCNALIERMRAANMPRLQIIIVLPKKPQALLEEMSVGITQAKLLRSLRETAAQTGHALGIYYTAAVSESGIEIPVYIHSKLLLVDDRFMTVGSANTTNRSMGLDMELNISWEATSLLQLKLIRSIRQTRITLLSEHAGITQCEECNGLRGVSGLVERLDALADSPPYRLRRHTPDTSIEENEWLKALKPDGFPFDPERPLIEEGLYELFSSEKGSLFTEGITLLKRWLLEKHEMPLNSKKSAR